MAEYRSITRYLPMAETKLRRVAGGLRGLSAGDAVVKLSAVHNRAAEALSRALSSAIANARQVGVRSPEDLRLHSLVINNGPMRKTIRPKSRGMAYVERARTSHVTAVLIDSE
jgi:large subunit ribosomal protein L22